MSITLYGHPFSSYCQKAQIALYENATLFDYRTIEPGSPANAEFARLWPLKRFPILTENGRTVLEATMIIEYLAVHHPGASNLLAGDADAQIEIRMLDRVFDNYIMTPVQKIVADSMRPADGHDRLGVSEARAMLDTAYAWLDQHMAMRLWASGADFSMADCAAAPSLFYADWAHEIPATLKSLKAYRARLLARPSVVRAVDEARPYRAYFPLGAPERD